MKKCTRLLCIPFGLVITLLHVATMMLALHLLTLLVLTIAKRQLNYEL